MYTSVYIYSRKIQRNAVLWYVFVQTLFRYTLFFRQLAMVDFPCSWHNKKMPDILSNCKCCRSCFLKIIFKIYILYSSHIAAHNKFKQLYLLNSTLTTDDRICCFPNGQCSELGICVCTCVVSLNFYYFFLAPARKWNSEFSP